MYLIRTSQRTRRESYDESDASVLTTTATRQERRGADKMD